MNREDVSGTVNLNHTLRIDMISIPLWLTHLGASTHICAPQVTGGALHDHVHAASITVIRMTDNSVQSESYKQ